MIRIYWQRAVTEWQANRRLRLAALVALVFAALQVVSMLEQRRQAFAAQYDSDLELQARLEGMREQKDWDQRAGQAQTALEEMRQRMPAVGSAGLAEAEMQNWLTGLATENALAESRIRVEKTLEVPGYPDMWQVMGRLDAQIPQYGNAGLLRGLSQGLPWIQAERLEIGAGTSARLALVVRGYYRREPAQP